MHSGASSLPFQKCVPTFWRLQNVAKEQRGKLKFTAYFACLKPLSIVSCLSCIINTLVTIAIWLWCIWNSLVWEEANEKDLFTLAGSNSSPLPWIWMDPGKLVYYAHHFSFCLLLYIISRHTKITFNQRKKTDYAYFDCLYGCEQTNNIFAPILTHGIYSAVVLGHGLWKIHDHRRRLRQRVQQLKLEEKSTRNL